VARVIHRQFRIRYHPSHVWRLLTARGWRCQPLELSATEKLTLLRMLQRGPRRGGHTLDRWTFGRMVELFGQAFGSYDPGRTRQALTANGWRCPRPAREESIKTRYTTWRLSRRSR
jgi:transposase